MSRRLTGPVPLVGGKPGRTPKRRVPLPCRHLNVERGACFDYCPDCGAVRSAQRPGEDAGPWHSCDGCRLVGEEK